MYFSIGIVIFALLVFLIFGTCRRNYAMKRVCSLCFAEKYELLSQVIAPFGYTYDCQQDLVSSRTDAWQRDVGYSALFDQAAASFNMVFDYLPVYFPYQNRTWLIEFWKGQYGINTGAEIGIYYADSLLSKEELSTAHFQAVTDKDMLPLAFALSKNDTLLARISGYTWWLTAFCMGQFSKPASLNLICSVQFPDCDMLYSFLNALYKTGIPKEKVLIHGAEIQLNFSGPQNRTYSFFTRIRRSYAQFANRLFCRIYLVVTTPFCLTLDRLLYLYYLLPFAFRRMLTPRGYYKYKKKHH